MDGQHKSKGEANNLKEVGEKSKGKQAEQDKMNTEDGEIILCPIALLYYVQTHAHSHDQILNVYSHVLSV